MGIASRNFSDGGGYYNCNTMKKFISPNPNPKDFEILEMWYNSEWTLALIKYNGCTTFEGLKLLLFAGNVSIAILSKKEIDPHFFEEDYLAPIARFEATQEGLRLARLLMEQTKSIANYKLLSERKAIVLNKEGKIGRNENT